MSSIAWKNNNNGDWDKAANWSGGVLPGASDNVTLSTLSARVITHSHAVDTIDTLTATTDSLAMTGGSLSILGTATFGAGLSSSGGMLAFLGAAASVAGSFSGAGGQIVLATGTAFTLNGTAVFGASGENSTGVEIDGAGTLTTTAASSVAETGSNGYYPAMVLGGAVTWINTATVSVAGYILTGDGVGLTATLINQAGASFDLTTDDASLYNGSGYSSTGQQQSGSSVFSNAGTFAKTGSAGGVSHVYSSFTNTGLVESEAGTLEFDGAIASTGTIETAGGNVTFAGGGTLGGTLSGGGTVAFAGGNTTLSAGLALSVPDLVLDGGTFTLSSALDLSAARFVETAGTLNLAGHTLTLNGANLVNNYATGAGAISLAGTTSIGGPNNTGAMSFGGSLTLLNTGTINQFNTIYVFYQTYAGFTISNAAGGTFNVQGDYAIGEYNYNSTSSTFVNTGTFIKAEGTNTTNIASDFISTGVVDVATGTVEFDAGGALGGSLIGTGTIAFAGGTTTLSAGLSEQVATLIVDGGTVNLSISLSVTQSNFTETGGAVGLNGNTLSVRNAILSNGYADSGTLSLNGNTVLSGYITGGNIYLGGNIDLANAGTITQYNNVYVDYGSGAGFTITNQAGATYDMAGDFYIGNNNYNGTSSTFSNAGTFAKTAGTNATQVVSVFNTTGTVDAATAGTIYFEDGGSFAGTLAGVGTIAFYGGNATLSAGTVLSVANLALDGASLTLAGNATPAGNFSFTNGALYLGGNTLTLAGAYIGYGTIDGPGSVSLSGTTTLAGYNGQSFYIGGSAAVTNAGVVNQDNSLQVSYQSGSGFAVTNRAAGTWNITGDFSIGGNNYNGTGSSFVNAGTFAKTMGTNTTQVISVFTNTGTVTAASGVIEFDGNGSILGGTLNGAGTISFASNTETLSGATITVADVVLNGAALVLGSNETIAGTFTETNGALYLEGHTFTVTGADIAYSALEGGTLLTSGATTLANNNTVTIGSGLDWSNSGTVTQDYYLNVDYGSGAGFAITNLAGATWALNGDFNLGGNNYNGVGSSFNNEGTFTRIGGNSYDLVYSVFTNTGTISAAVGEIAFESGGVFGGSITGPGLISFQNNVYSLGGLTAAATAGVQFYQSTIMLTASTSINGTLNGIASTVQLGGQSLALAALTVTNPGQGLTFDGAGTVTTTGATSIVDWYSNGLMFDLGGSATWANTGTATVSGLIQFGDSDLVGGDAAGTLTNAAGAVFDLATDDASIIVGTYYDGYRNLHSSLGFITNAGVFAKTGGTATSNVYAQLTSTGTLATTSGTLALDAGGGVSGSIADGSNIVFAAGVFTNAALAIGGGATVGNAATIQASGALTLGDASSTVATFTNTGTYAIEGNVGIAPGKTAGSIFANTGTLEKLGGTGRGAIAVGVVNSGTIFADSGTLALTGSVSGTGLLQIGAGAVLELGAGIGPSQSVSFIGAGGTLLLDAPTSTPATISGFAVGETIDLSKLVATTAAVNGSDQLIVKNGSSVVATLQLAGAHTGDVYSVTSDKNGGSLITIAKTTTAWTGTSNDWFAANVWTNGAPGPGTDATIAITGSYSPSLNYGEIAYVKSLTLNAPNAGTTIDGTLNVGTTLTLASGAFALNGTLDGGVLARTGGTTSFSGGLLENVGFQGLLDLSANYNNVSLSGTTAIAAAGGSGNGTINLTGYQAALYADGLFTLDKTVVNIGNDSANSVLESIDPDGQGGVLTLGAKATIIHTGTNAQIADQSGLNDAVYNEGTITASLAGGQFQITGSDFQNDGTITVNDGDDFSVRSASFVNTGKLTASSGTLGLYGSLLNTGSITATRSLLNLGGPITGAQLAAIALGSDTANLSGSLNLGTVTLAVGSSSKITALTLTGSIENGSIAAPGTAITFDTGATLDNVTYTGTVSVGSGMAVNLDGLITGAVILDPAGSAVFGAGMILNKDSYDGTLALAAGDTVGVEGGLKLAGSGGTGLGTIVAPGGATAATLSVLDTETLNNAVINSGANGGQGLFLSAAAPTGGTLTLGTKLTFNVLAGSTAGLLSVNPTTQATLGDAIVNAGTIALAAGAIFEGSPGSVGTFTNTGHITLAAGAVWTTDGGTLTGEQFVNSAAGSIALSTGATLVTNGGGLNNAGSITLGTNSVLTDQGNFTESGKTAVAKGGIFSILGTTTLADIAGISGAGTLGIDGTLNLAKGTFDMAATGRITNVQFGGLIENGTVLNDAGTLTFGPQATLNNITWKGPLNVGAGGTVQAQSLTVETASGGTPGTINLSSGGNIDYLASQTLDNLTITSSSPQAGVGNPSIRDGIELAAAGGTLTLGAHFVLDANAGATEFTDLGAPSTGTALINNGTINVTAGALWLLDPSFANVVNNASIVMGTNTEIGANPTLTGSGNFTNAGTVTMAQLDDFAVSGNATNSKLWTVAAGGEVTVGGNFTNSGSFTLGSGAALEANGAVKNSGTIIASGATPDLISGIDTAGSSYNAGTLTGGVWDVSASSTLTLDFSTALTTDAADLVLGGTGAVLRSVGTAIQRVESTLGSIASGGTLSVLGARGYSTSLALQDSGVLNIAGGTLSAGGLTITAGGALTGSGSVSTAISNAGSIVASGGTLTLAAAVTGAGVLDIGAGAVLELGVANTETVAFQSATSELKLDTPTSFTGTLSGFSAGDSIELVSTNGTAATLSGTSLTVKLSGGGTEVFKLAASAPTTTLTVTSDGSGDTIVTFPTGGGATPPIIPAGTAGMRFLAPPVSSTSEAGTIFAGLAHDPGGGAAWLGPDVLAPSYEAVREPAHPQTGHFAIVTNDHDMIGILHPVLASSWRL